MELNPNADEAWAFRLSNIIYVKAKQYKIDPMITVAIARQESGLRQINRVETGVDSECLALEANVCYRYDDECKKFLAQTKCPMRSVVTDIGVFQIHVDTATHYGFNAYRLANDMEYQVDSHMKVLKKKLKACRHLGDEAWSCYHSATPRLRKKYLKLVERYLPPKLEVCSCKAEKISKFCHVVCGRPYKGPPIKAAADNERCDCSLPKEQQKINNCNWFCAK
jgi:hypothetical protein